jgi:glycerol-3-phosphate acyltransferase PlsY
MGTAIAAGVIAVVGTLLGSITSGLMQRRIAQDGLAARRASIAAHDRLLDIAADNIGVTDVLRDRAPTR